MRPIRLPLLIAICLVAAAFEVAAYAQFDRVDEAWARSLASPSGVGVVPLMAQATPDGGFLVLGRSPGLPTVDGQTVVTKLSENGDVEWSDEIDSPAIPDPAFNGGRMADVVIDADGTAYVLISRPTTSIVHVYAASGTLVREVQLPQAPGFTSYNPGYLALARTGELVVCGIVDEASYPRADVRKFAPDGTLLWAWRGDGGSFFGNTAQSFARGMTIGADGTIYVYGRSDRPGQQSGARVIALSADGVYRWTRGEFTSGPPFVNAKFDAQGNIVLVSAWRDAGLQTVRLFKLRPNGSEVFRTDLDVPSTLFRITSLGIDTLDRIVLGGSRRVGFPGPLIPTLLRFDAGGGFAGLDTPSVALAGEDGRIAALAVTPRNDVVAFGVSGDGSDQVILARFAPDGSERWAERRSGVRPLDAGPDVVDLGFAADPRGNVLTLAQTAAGAAPTELILAKFVQNGPAGAAYCGPAQLNSTGQPASLRALGPSTLSANNVTLRVDNLPTGTPTLFLASRTQGLAMNVGGGQGTLCLGGSIGRFLGPGELRFSDSGGSSSLQLDLGHLPQPMGRVAAIVGESWNLQAWYRDSNPSPTSNLTDGVSVMVQ